MTKGLCDVSMSHLFTLLVVNWSETAIILTAQMIIAYFIATTDFLWPMTVHGNSLSVNRLHKKAETMKQNLGRHYEEAKQDSTDKEKE